MTTDGGRADRQVPGPVRAGGGRLADQAGPVRRLVHLPGRHGPLPRVEERRCARHELPDLPEPGVGLHDGPREHRRRAHPDLDGLGGPADRLGARPGELPEAGRYVLRQHHRDRRPDADGHDRRHRARRLLLRGRWVRGRHGARSARRGPVRRQPAVQEPVRRHVQRQRQLRGSLFGRQQRRATRGRLQDRHRERLRVPERRADHGLAQPRTPRPAERRAPRSCSTRRTATG